MASLGSFFKIIMDSTSNNVIIPLEFMRRYGHDLPNRVFLELPNGKKSIEVELNKVDGQTLIQRGWMEFKQPLSLGFGHLLMFEYNGNSWFNVRIFDTSAVEIDYPLESDDCDVLLDHFSTIVENQDNTLAPNDVIEISDDYYSVKKSPKTTKNISSCYKKGPQTEHVHPNPRSERTMGCKVKHDESTDRDYGECSVTGTQFPKGATVKKETSIAYQRAVAFASRLKPQDNPFHIHLMHKSQVAFGFSLKLPLSFARPSLPCARTNSLTLVTNGKTWSVRCLVNDRYANLSGGWAGFAKGNGLKVGDVCIFEVANKSNKQPLWNVIIFRS